MYKYKYFGKEDGAMGRQVELHEIVDWCNEHKVEIVTIIKTFYRVYGYHYYELVYKIKEETQ